MAKYYSEVTLLNQTFVLDNDKTVKTVIDEFSKNNSFMILKYNTFILGEE